MFAAAALSVVVLVLGTLSATLGEFPGMNGAGSQGGEQNEETQDVRTAAEDVSVKLTSVYTSVVDDLIKYMKDPDGKRAEQTQQAMVNYAGNLALRFKGLSNGLSNDLQSLQQQAAAESQTPS